MKKQIVKLFKFLLELIFTALLVYISAFYGWKYALVFIGCSILFGIYGALVMVVDYLPYTDYIERTYSNILEAVEDIKFLLPSQKRRGR